MAAQSPPEFRRILRLFRPYRARLTLVAALVGLSSVVSLASPFMLRAVLDDALPHGRTGLLTVLAAGMIAVVVVIMVVVMVRMAVAVAVMMVIFQQPGTRQVDQ